MACCSRHIATFRHYYCPKPQLVFSARRLWTCKSPLFKASASHYPVFQFKSSHLGQIDAAPNERNVERLLKGLLEGNRGALAESITLIESVHPRKRAEAQLLLNRVLAVAKEKSTKLGHVLGFRAGKQQKPTLVIGTLKTESFLL